MDTAVINQNTLCNILYQLLLFRDLVIQCLAKCKFWKFTRLLTALVALKQNKTKQKLSTPYPTTHYSYFAKENVQLYSRKGKM